MDFLNKLLKHYNLSLEEFNELKKEVKREDLLNLSSFDNAQITLDCLKSHIQNNDRIMIYGDYDCDGMMATSIFKIAFNRINYKLCGYTVPSRYIDGYGLNLENTKKFIEMGVKLLILVDNGISQFEAIDYAVSHGCDVIICDHHEIRDNTLPNTPYIIHPSLSRAKSICSGGYTAFVLATEMIGRFDEYMFCLAGISIISDLMELKNENRDIVKHTIELLKKGKFYQLNLLADGEITDENKISMIIAPKINSLGRILEGDKINLIVRYLSTDDINEINYLYRFIEENNNIRKEITNSFNYDFESRENDLIIVEKMDVKEGLIGLIANRYLDTLKKPAIIFTKGNEEGILKGSIRSKNGIFIPDMFSAIKEHLINYGGHDFAGGLSIKESDFEVVKEKLNKFVIGKSFIEENDDYIDISLNDITYQNLEIVELFAPFGVANKAPVFRVKNFPIKSFNYSKDRIHIITKLSPKSSMIKFNYDPEILNYKTCDFIGTFKANYFKESKNANFIIKDFIKLN